MASNRRLIMNPHIKIIDIETDIVLYTFELSKQEDAFNKAKELEDMGLDIKLSTPTSIEVLGSALGADQELLNKVSVEIDKEISSHN